MSPRLISRAASNFSSPNITAFDSQTTSTLTLHIYTHIHVCTARLFKTRARYYFYLNEKNIKEKQYITRARWILNYRKR
jgi:hypothetical protein